MKVYKEISTIYELREMAWGQAVSNIDRLIDYGIGNELVDIMESVMDGESETAINDILAYDFYAVLEWFDLVEDFNGNIMTREEYEEKQAEEEAEENDENDEENE